MNATVITDEVLAHIRANPKEKLFHLSARFGFSEATASKARKMLGLGRPHKAGHRRHAMYHFGQAGDQRILDCPDDAVIAAEFNTTPKYVALRRKTLAQRLSWTEGKLNELSEMVTCGYNMSELREHFDATEHEVQTQLDIIGHSIRPVKVINGHRYVITKLGRRIKLKTLEGTYHGNA